MVVQSWKNLVSLNFYRPDYILATHEFSVQSISAKIFFYQNFVLCGMVVG